MYTLEMNHHITLKDLRPQLPQVIEQIDTELDRFVVSKHGKPVAIILAMDEYESLIETLNELEDKEGLKRIKKSLLEAKRGKTTSWDKIKSKHNLK